MLNGNDLRKWNEYNIAKMVFLENMQHEKFLEFKTIY